MSKILDLKAASQLVGYWDFRKGTLLDRGCNSLGSLAIFSTPTWARTRKGFGVWTPAAGINYLTPGNPASLQLSTATLFAVASRSETVVGDWQSLLFKSNAFNMMFLSEAEPKRFGCWDNGGAAVRASTFAELPNGRVHLYAISFVSGAVNGTAFYVDGIPCGLATTTVVNQASNLGLGWGVGGGNVGVGGAILEAGVINRVLRPDEHMELYTDWLKEGWVLDLGSTRNGVKHFLPDKNDADYVRDGIVLDTDFVRQPGGTIRDLSPSGYAGTVGGVPVPGPNGEGIKTASTDYVDWGDVTQLNSVLSFTIEMWFETPVANIPTSYLTVKATDGTHMVGISCLDAPATSKALYLQVYNGAASFAMTSVPVIRSGTKQHVLGVFNGGGVGDPGRAQLYIDGEAYACNFPGGAIPATTANLVGASLYTEYVAGLGMPATYNGQRLSTPPATPAQARERYLKNFGQKLIWQAPGEDCPVSLAASYGVATPNALGGGWQIISGTWKNSEDSQGRRWAECVTAGALGISQSNAFGTLVFTINQSAASPEFDIQFNANLLAAKTALGQDGYVFATNAVRQVFLARWTNGANAAYLCYTAVGYVGSGVDYRYAINRRPSDGRFTVYIKGGAYTNWTLMSVAGGGFTNPTAAESTYTTSKFCVLNFAAGDKILINDPNTIGNPGHPRMWQGVLSPLLGEVQ